MFRNQIIVFDHVSSLLNNEDGLFSIPSSILQILDTKVHVIS